MSLLNWEKASENLSINEKVVLLSNTLFNIFCNYVPKKIVKCSYRDPPWITKKIKPKLKNRSKITKGYYRKDQDPTIFAELSRISIECTDLIRNAIIADRTDRRVYWTVLNNFLKNIKIPSVSPILIFGETIANIGEKANIFNEFFAFQCTPFENNSKLPSLLMNTDKRLNIFSIKKEGTASIIKSLNPTKAHGFESISVCMIQLCPSVQIFKASLTQGVFPDTWKMVNIIPVHKKRQNI